MLSILTMRDYIFIGMIIVLSIIVFAQSHVIETRTTALGECKTLQAVQNQAIAHTAAVQQAGHDKVRAAQKLSLIHQENYQKEVNTINSSDVPDDCDGAMGWLVDQNKNFEAS